MKIARGFPSLLLALVLAPWTFAEKYDEAGGVPDEECIAPNGVGECIRAPPSSVYVIGDLHGDATCAVSWVNRTGLVANLLEEDPAATEMAPLFQKLNSRRDWRWTDKEATLVFMGDYVDKGPTSRQTVEFVKDLTDAFPDRVTAILGNHELELLRDRDARISPVERYSAYSYATVHPGEYHNYFHDPRRERRKDANATDPSLTPARSLDGDDDLVLGLLFEAVMEVYTSQAHAAVRMVPSLPDRAEARRQGIMFAITDLMPPQHRPLAKERLAEYIDAYLDAFRSGSVLGEWLEQRPVAHLEMGTLFVHGGVSQNVGKAYLSRGKESVDKLNAIWREHSNESRLRDFLEGKGTTAASDVVGHAVYQLLTHRGNHPGYAKWETHGTFDEFGSDVDEVCNTLHATLGHMEGIARIAVGHTPLDDVQIRCDGAFLALDSTLGRWIRGSGNEYCPGPEYLEIRKGANVPRTSRDGRYRCEEIGTVCEGQIVRLDSDGSVNILTL